MNRHPASTPPPSRLRITHLVTNAQFAGTERYVVDVSTALHERGHHVAVIGGKPESMRRLLPPGVRWHAGATAGTGLRRLVSGGRRDIVHSHMAKSDFVAAMGAPATGGARVSTRHITAPRGYSPTARRLGRLIRAGLASEIAVSQWTSDQLDRRSDIVLLNGVASQPDVTGPRSKVVLLAQRLDPEKDTITALQAWARSGLGTQGWTLRIAGTGSEREQLVALTDGLGIAESVEFAGWLPELGEAYRTSSMFFAPAPAEPCGLSILEAMAQGLPVVAAAAGGPLETVGRVPEPVLFAAGDPGAAAARLCELADDPAKRQRYGNALRDVQRRSFSIDGHVDRLEILYRELAPRRGHLR